MRDCHTLSMDGCTYTFDDFDNDAQRLGLNRSQFMQKLYIDFKEKRNINDYVAIIMLLGFGVIILMLIFMR